MPNHTDCNPPCFGFDKTKRLLVPSDFKAVFDNPVKKIHSTHFLLFVGKGVVGNNTVGKSDKTSPCLGLAITKKKLKKAVDRNLVKRHARELFRLNQHQLPHLDCVLIVKSGAFIGSKKQKVAREAIKQTIHSELFEIFNKLSQLGITDLANKTDHQQINADPIKAIKDK